MQNDQRLTPLPLTHDIQPATMDYSPATYAGSYDDSLDNKRSIRQYFNIVYKRLPIILAITLIVTAVAAFYSYQQPSVYRVQTSMIIEPRKPEVTRKESININFGDDQQYYNTQLNLLKNAGLMKRVVIALGLQREPNLFPEQTRGFIAGVRSLFSGGQTPTATPENSVAVVTDASIASDKKVEIQLTPEETARADLYAKILAGGLIVNQIEKTNIVNLDLLTSNQFIAPRVTDKVAELFIEEDRLRGTSGAERSYNDLKVSIEELKATIGQQENDFITEMRLSNLPLQDKGGDLRAGNLEALLAQWRSSQEEASKLWATFNAAQNASKSGDILAVVGDNKAIQDARSQNLKRQADLEQRIEAIDTKIYAAEEQRKGLQSKYQDIHPQIVEKTAQIAQLREQRAAVNREVSEKIKYEGTKLVKDAEREALASLRAQLAAAQQREARQRVVFEQAATKANYEGQVETKMTGLSREIASNRSLLDTYVSRQKEQELAMTSERPDNIKIQNTAVTPTLPEGPERVRNILLALFMSLGAGIGLAFLLDYLDDSVRTSDDISRHLGLPTLALIPHYLINDKLKVLTAKAGNGNGNVPGAGAGLITMDERNSPMAEAYRHLRTSLLFSSAGKPPQTILITSSQPSEGKTTTAINTAITLAQGDADVVIIDCDLRRPRLHSRFGLENSRGLTNYLSGDKDTEGLIRTYADLPRLKIITSGPIPPNPAELLSSNEMRNLLQFLSGKFKHVIIDSPPAISFTDASILSTLVDGVVLVALAGKSSIHLMRQFKHRVNTIGARIYGVVLNGIKAGSTEYYYYGSGYYNYYARPHDDESTPYLNEEAREEREGKEV